MDPVDWLLEGDPAIRWQVMRDLTDQPPAVVAAERDRVAGEGWGARLLSLQGPDGNWGGGVYTPKWTSTTYTLLLLRHLGIHPEAPRVRESIGRVEDGVVMGRRPFFAYRGETCVTGMVLSLASYFGATTERGDVVDWLLGEQLDDGGWNCATTRGSTRSSFHTTISVVEALLDWERRGAGKSKEVAQARERAHEYLLERRLFRRLSTGEPASSRFTLFSFPPRWHYDILRGLDYLRNAGLGPDPRAEEAVEIVERRRGSEGSWPLQNPHPGKVHFDMDPGPRRPSRWNTLRALRVIRWYRGQH